MKQEPNTRKQANTYDKVFKENMELALPGIIEHLLKLHIVQSEEIPDDLQHTKERKPDVLKKVTDATNQTYILHIEWQLKNERDMVYRMVEYRAMLQRKYRLPVKQFVLFVGKGRVTMATTINDEDFKFRYTVISLADIDYRLFLRSNRPEEKILAILANFGNDSAEEALGTILWQVKAVAKGGFAESRYFNQLRILVQLRNLQLKFDKAMISLTSFYKEEKDPYYMKGERKGIEKGEVKKSIGVVENLIIKLGLTDEQTAEIADVSVAFVREIRLALKK